MANYSRIFGSQFPEALITLSNFKDVGDASDNVKELIQQFYAFMESKDIVSAAALFEANYAVLKPYYVGMEWFNKAEEELYNIGLYAKKNSNTVISDTEPDASEYTETAVWLKPVN